jgi:phage FluMu gp28-like protein
MGIDFGRKQDLSVCWILERNPDALWTREVLVMERASTPLQLEQLRPRAARARRVCIDYTGSGVGLGDLLANEFGEWSEAAGAAGGKIELCSFTPGFKQELFPRLRAAFERGTVWIPASPEIREDLHGVQRRVSAQGQIQYRASHTADGHSDRCTALALALRAADLSGPPPKPSSIGAQFRGRSLARIG